MPTFIIPKVNGTVRFISDFRELNKRIKLKPFPIPNSQDSLLKYKGLDMPHSSICLWDIIILLYDMYLGNYV